MPTPLKIESPSETGAAEVVHHPIDAMGFKIIKKPEAFQPSGDTGVCWCMLLSVLLHGYSSPPLPL
ncbi:MAG: hypothetical protein GXO97_06645, partial [Nitrospirae bacterium]|nr:hypothetical protein [Nitrospirota bacterium]